MKFRTRPSVIEAEKFLGTDESAEHVMTWAKGADIVAECLQNGAWVLYLDDVKITAGDYIIKQTACKYEVMRPSEFNTQFEEVKPLKPSPLTPEELAEIAEEF